MHVILEVDEGMLMGFVGVLMGICGNDIFPGNANSKAPALSPGFFEAERFTMPSDELLFVRE